MYELFREYIFEYIGGNYIITENCDKKLKILSSSSSRDINSIYGSMSEYDKKMVQGMEKDSNKPAPKLFVTDSQLKAKDHIKTIILKYGDTPVSIFEVWDKGDGVVNVTVMSRGENDYRHKGYANTVVQRGMNWLEKHQKALNIKRINWEVHKDNTYSIMLAKKYGFKKANTNTKTSQWITYSKILSSK